MSIYKHTYVNLSNECFTTHIDLNHIAAVQYPVLDDKASRLFFRITFRSRAKPVDCVYTEKGFAALIAAWNNHHKEHAT